ncbi:hypothetical protein GCM10022224_103090 [Nonomuraea antimicrobica]|uniref:DUF2207 domain-containing protein n=1 Tax=Nonomuraea antimicrobica TaxID=561173 RepID=A0ABP7EKG0_9ACTN
MAHTAHGHENGVVEDQGALSALIPRTSCLLGPWLAKVDDLSRVLTAEILALGNDGYVVVLADYQGYTLRRGPKNPDDLRQDRAAVLNGLFGQDDEVQMARPQRLTVPAFPPGYRISLSAVRKAVGRAIGGYGLQSRLTWPALAGVVLGVALALFALVVGAYPVALFLSMGMGMLGTAWQLGGVRLSRFGRAERHRMLALRERLEHDVREGVVMDSSTSTRLLPWAHLLLDRKTFSTWCEHQRPPVSFPPWWIWTDDPQPDFVSDAALFGFIAAFLRQVRP